MAEQNAVFDRATGERIARFVKANDGAANLGGNGGAVTSTAPLIILAKITDVDGVKCAWEQVRLQSDGSAETLADGLTGTTTERPAYTLGSTSAAIDDIVFLQRVILDNGDDTFSVAYGVIGAGGEEAPCGFQYQAKYAVAAGVMDCDWLRAYPVT